MWNLVIDEKIHEIIYRNKKILLARIVNEKLRSKNI